MEDSKSSLPGHLLLSNSCNDLIVKKTTLPDCDFLGLFANKDFEKDSIVCVYTGNVLRTRDALRLEDKSYLMRLGEQCYIDAKDTLDVVARYSFS